MGVEPQILDARGLNCPLPVLKAQKRLRAMRPGEALEVWADDPKAPADFEHYAKASGHEIRDIEQGAEGLRVVIIKKR